LKIQASPPVRLPRLSVLGQEDRAGEEHGFESDDDAQQAVGKRVEAARVEFNTIRAVNQMAWAAMNAVLPAVRAMVSVSRSTAVRSFRVSCANSTIVRMFWAM